MSFESAVDVAFGTLVVIVFAAGVFVGAAGHALVRWFRDRREPVRVVTITMESRGTFTWEVAYDMDQRPFALGTAGSWQDARLQGLHAFIPDVEVEPGA